MTVCIVKRTPFDTTTPYRNFTNTAQAKIRLEEIRKGYKGRMFYDGLNLRVEGDISYSIEIQEGV